MKERKIKQLMTLEDLFIDQNKFPIYFVVKFPRMEIDRELNVIATDNEIKMKIEQPSKRYLAD